MVQLTLTELAGVVFVAVMLATTDAAAVSRLALAFASKKLGVKPADIQRYDDATDGESGDAASTAETPADDPREGNT